IKARAYVFKSSQDINQPLQSIGVIDFAQYGGYVRVNGTVSGLTPGQHGFHVHEKGDLGNGCLNAGAHFNPTEQTHGGQSDTVRHVGDLGNLNVDNSGIAHIEFDDSMIALYGPFSIVGRSIVIHESADDLGKGGTEASQTTGNSGARIGCGIIGITN
uniref:Superoxide dismutase [Cu-Zn] n=1 Tax=Syphacia muris TaxID=451379 RepID=A0A0N5AYC5_9BILA